MTNKNNLRIAFMGAVACVTGSSTLLEYRKANADLHYYLVDCGVCQQKEARHSENIDFLFSMASKIRAIFLTHAHYDHIGLLPQLIEHDFTGKIYCTKASKELSKIMLADGMRINNMPKEKIQKVLKIIDTNTIAFDTQAGFLFGNTKKPITIDDGLYMYPLRTSHILGSCSFTFSWTKEENAANNHNLSNREAIHFSGDIGPADEKSVKEHAAQSILLKDFSTPYYGYGNKYIVLESTYGDRIRDKKNLFQKKISRLTDILEDTQKKGGTVLIPAFSLNRVQEILVDLYYIQNKTRVFTKEWFIENNKTEREFLECFDKLNRTNNTESGSEYQKFTELVWRKEFLDRPKNYLKFDDSSLFKKIPSHAQEKFIRVLNALNERYGQGMNISVSLASSLAEKINSIYTEHLFASSMNKDEKIKFHYASPLFFEEFCSDVTDDKKDKEAKNILQNIFKQGLSHLVGHNVIISSSGMCDSGQVLESLPLLTDENNTIILTGYQAEDTNGAMLKKLQAGSYSDADLYNIKLNNTNIRLNQVKCRIEDMGAFYSGHADQEQLVEYVHGFNNARQENTFPTTVFLNHGTETQRNALKKAIEDKNNDQHSVSVLLPDALQWYNLNNGKWEEVIAINEQPESNPPKKNENSIHIKLEDGIEITFPVGYDVKNIANIITTVRKISET